MRPIIRCGGSLALLGCAWIFWHAATPMRCVEHPDGQVQCMGPQQPWRYQNAYETRQDCDAALAQARDQEKPRAAVTRQGTELQRTDFTYACLPVGLLPRDAE